MIKQCHNTHATVGISNDKRLICIA